MKQRRNFVWGVGAISTSLAALSVATAVSLVREQRTAALDLREAVAHHRAAAELEECFVDLIALTKDRVRFVDSLHDRAASLLAEIRSWESDSQLRQQVSSLTLAFEKHRLAWREFVDSPDQDDANVTRMVRALENELLRPSTELETTFSTLVQSAADEHTALSRRVSWGLVWVGGVGGIACLALGFGVSRGLSRSIKRLQVQVRSAAGKLDPTATEIVLTGGADVGSLHSEMESLTQRIEEIVGTLQQREREVLRAEQLAALGQLAAGVAHEVRNPLTSIKLLVQAELESQSPGGMSSEDLRVIEGEVQRMERTLQGFLDYARPARLERRTVNLAMVAQNVVGLIRLRAERQRVTIDTNTSRDGVLVFADSGQLQQVVLNLVLNALDAMPRGGRLRIDVEKHENGNASLAVTDTGPGIDAAMREKLFQPFATNKETGLGLGLAISRRIVEAHGGQLLVTPSSTSGATLTMTLPVS